MPEHPQDSPPPPAASSISFQFCVLRVLQGESHALAALALQDRIWNDLLREERRFDRRLRAFLHAADPALRKLDIQVIQVIKSRRSRRSSTSPDIPSQALQQNVLSELDQMVREARERRARVIAAHKDGVKALDAAHEKELRRIAATAGLWWQFLEGFWARYRTARLRARKAGQPLRPRDLSGTGSLSIRFNAAKQHQQWGHLTSGASKLARLVEPTPEELGSRVKHVKGDGGRRMVLEVPIAGVVVEVGSERPILRLLVTLHRSCPGDLQLTTLVLKRDGGGQSLDLTQGNTMAEKGGYGVRWLASFTFSGPLPHQGAGPGESKERIEDAPLALPSDAGSPAGVPSASGDPPAVVTGGAVAPAVKRILLVQPWPSSAFVTAGEGGEPVVGKLLGLDASELPAQRDRKAIQSLLAAQGLNIEVPASWSLHDRRLHALASRVALHEERAPAFGEAGVHDGLHGGLLNELDGLRRRARRRQMAHFRQWAAEVVQGVDQIWVLQASALAIAAFQAGSAAAAKERAGCAASGTGSFSHMNCSWVLRSCLAHAARRRGVLVVELLPVRVARAARAAVD